MLVVEFLFVFDHVQLWQRIQNFGMLLWSSQDEEFWTTWIHKLDSDDLLNLILMIY
jgi:hypothetical protein